MDYFSFSFFFCCFFFFFARGERLNILTLDTYFTTGYFKLMYLTILFVHLSSKDLNLASELDQWHLRKKKGGSYKFGYNGNGLIMLMFVVHVLCSVRHYMVKSGLI